MTTENRYKIIKLKKLINDIRQYGAMDLEEGLARLEDSLDNMGALDNRVPEEKITNVLDTTEIVAAELLKQAKRIHALAKQQRQDSRFK